MIDIQKLRQQLAEAQAEADDAVVELRRFFEALK